MNRNRPLAVVAALGVSASLALPAVATAKPTITMSGSTWVAPLAALLAQKYVSVCGHCVNFKLLQGGSDVGVSDVASGRVTIGNSSRDPKPSDPGGLVFNKIAHDAICIDHQQRRTRCRTSTRPACRRSSAAASATGASVPGSSASGTIDSFVRTPASGTQDAFQKIFLGSTKVFSGASAEGVQRARSSSRSRATRTAIGYVSLAFTEGVHAVPYKGVACTLRNAKSGQYGGVRNFYMVTRGAAERRRQEVDQVDHARARRPPRSSAPSGCRCS